MSNHTPGPWEYDKNVNGDFLITTTIDLPALTESEVAVVFNLESAPKGVSPEANARLIAAAPDLLEAITEMMHDIDIFYSKYREPGNARYSKLKTAIKKANGES